jgi:hypothetical protein
MGRQARSHLSAASACLVVVRYQFGTDELSDSLSNIASAAPCLVSKLIG